MIDTPPLLITGVEVVGKPRAARGTAVYRHRRDSNARRAYLRDYQRKRRAAIKAALPRIEAP